MKPPYLVCLEGCWILKHQQPSSVCCTCLEQYHASLPDRIYLDAIENARISPWRFHMSPSRPRRTLIKKATLADGLYWRRCVGIEPTNRGLTRPTGVEDQLSHQAQSTSKKRSPLNSSTANGNNITYDTFIYRTILESPTRRVTPVISK